MKDVPRRVAACQVPAGGRAREGSGVRNCHCLSPLSHHWHAPASAASRVPRLQHVSREPSRRSSQVGRTGAWHGGPFPASSTLVEAPEKAEAGAEDVMPPAAVACGASPGACLSHRWAGRGGAFAPRGAQEDSAPRNLATNSLPPGRVPGLLPFSAPYGLRPCSVHREVLCAPLWACAPPHPQVQPTRTGPAGQAGPARPRVTRAQGGPTSWFLCLKSTPENTCPRDPHNPARQGQQAVPATGVDAQICVLEMAGAPFRSFPPTLIRNQAGSPPLPR